MSPESAGLRISDADREQAASDLSEHYAEGRLTTTSTRSGSTRSGRRAPTPT
jgi:hypothetical protein